MVIFLQHVALSRGTLSRSHLPAAYLLPCYSVGCLLSLVSLCIGQILQSRPAPGLRMTCLSAVVTLSLIVVFHFLRRFVPCVLVMFALVRVLRLHTNLHTHKNMSMYCCVLVISRFSFRICMQLAILVLSQMRQASTRPFSIFSTFASVMMSSITVSDD